MESKRILWRCILCCICSIYVCLSYFPSIAKEREEKEIDFTCYIDQGTCYTGCKTRKGIAAADKSHIGYTAIVYTLDDEFVGIYEVLDKIGTEWGRKGNCIDIWCENIEEAKEMMKLTQGKCKVIYVWAEG